VVERGHRAIHKKDPANYSRLPRLVASKGSAAEAPNAWWLRGRKNAGAHARTGKQCNAQAEKPGACGVASRAGMAHGRLSGAAIWDPASKERRNERSGLPSNARGIGRGTRDPLLGWPTKGFLETHADADGARLSPANGRFSSTPVCVSTYGDSFTYSDEVGRDDAWPNVLAEHLRCPVKNYGVPAYGIDQAVLRFRNNIKDNANLSILGFYVLDVTRNMNQWRYLMNGGDPLLFKPAFARTSNGELAVEPIPVNSYDDFLRTIENPADVLTAERYLPDAPALPAPLRAKFPYTLSLAYFVKKQILDELRLESLSSSAQLRNWNYPSWYDTEDGPWPVTIALNTAIVGEFAQECRRRERRCVVLVVPDIASIRLVQKEGRSELEQFLQPIEQYLKVWRTVEFFARQTERLGVCYYSGSNATAGVTLIPKVTRCWHVLWLSKSGR
jgi:hypothetical protein